MSVAVVDPRLGWNLVEDVRRLFDYAFMVNALRAGSLVAVTAALVGWFMVLRRQSFAGHTLAVVGFPGGAGAVLVGASAPVGSFVFCVLGAAVLAVAGSRRDRPATDGATIGLVQAAALACGFLFATLGGGNVNAAGSLLFGTFLGITGREVGLLLGVAIVAVVTLSALARPLLFASVDPDVAAARGIRVRALSFVFLLLLAVAAAAAAQITGALLVFALLVLPAATAQALTTRPARSLLVTVGVALAVTWLGLAIAYYSPWPVGFWITTVAFGAYVAARGAATSARRWA